MTALHPDMVPPEGQVVSTSTTFDVATLNIQMSAQNPWLAAEIDPTKARVLTKDLLFSRRSGRGLAHSSKARAFGGLRSFSVLNGLGRRNDTKFDFFRDHWFCGLSANMMEAHAIKSGTGMHVAVNVQGMTYTPNTGDDHVRAGDQIMYDVPENTDDAKRREIQRGPLERGMPANRFTAFPKVFRISNAIRNIRTDWAGLLRIAPGERVVHGRHYYFPSTRNGLRFMRRCLAAGAALREHMVGVNDPVAMIEAIRDMANDPQRNQWYSQLALGDHDAYVAALLFPNRLEHVVPGSKPAPADTDVTRLFHTIQRAGFDDLLMIANRAVDESGRGRVIGRAIAPAKPGEPISLLLYGH